MSEPILILFDCDGTLLDSAALIVDVMTKSFASQDVATPTPAQIRSRIGLNLDEVMAGLGMPEHKLLDAVAYYKHEMRRRRSQAPLPEPMFAGVEDWLRDLASMDRVLLGVATGKSLRGLEASLAHHGIAELFAVLRTPDHGPGKPDPFMVHDACAHVGVRLDHAIMIGDTTYDMMMARSAGALALGVSWGYHDPSELLAAGAHDIMVEPAGFCPVDYFLRPDV